MDLKTLIDGDKIILRNVASYVAPFFFGDPKLNSAWQGSIFFISIEEGIIGITADHVYQGYLDEKDKNQSIKCYIMQEVFDIENKLIDRNSKLDVATFTFTEIEIEKIARAVYRIEPKYWPVDPPIEGQEVIFAGYPGVDRHIRGQVVDIGCHMALHRVQSISDKDISCVFEREYMVDALGHGLPQPKQFLGGISGGPLFKLITNGIERWELVGIVYEFDQDNEILKARQTKYILPDGRIDITLLPLL